MKVANKNGAERNVLLQASPGHRSNADPRTHYIYIAKLKHTLCCHILHMGVNLWHQSEASGHGSNVKGTVKGISNQFVMFQSQVVGVALGPSSNKWGC